MIRFDLTGDREVQKAPNHLQHVIERALRRLEVLPSFLHATEALRIGKKETNECRLTPQAPQSDT